MRRRGIPQLRRDVGMVFQDHRLLIDRTVFDNVALPLIIAGIAREEIGKRVRAALDKVGLLAKEKRSPLDAVGRRAAARRHRARDRRQAAGDHRRRADRQSRSAAVGRDHAALRRVRRRRHDRAVASHDLHLVKRLNKRVLVLDHGRLIDDFRPAP